MTQAVNASVQTVATGGGIVFGSSRIQTGCNVRHEEGSSRFVLLAPGIYSVRFVGNIAVPTGGTVAPISIGLSVDGEGVTGTEAIFTPVEVEEYGNVSVDTLVRVYGCCTANVGVSVVNTSDTEINVQDANLLIVRECGGVNG